MNETVDDAISVYYLVEEIARFETLHEDSLKEVQCVYSSKVNEADDFYEEENDSDVDDSGFQV